MGMQRELSFNICSIVILTILLFSLFSRKMTKGKANSVFILISVCALISSISDFLRWIIPVREAPSSVSLLFSYFWTYVYFIFRNSMSSLFLVYILILSGMWFTVKENKKARFYPFIIPCFVVITVLINSVTHHIFYLDSDLTFHRGKYVLLMYIYSFIPLVVSAIILVKHKSIFKTVDFWTIVAIFPSALIGVFFQLFHPKYLVENITTTFVIFAISLIIHRPEENMNISTKSLGFNAYVQELKRDFKNNTPISLIFIHINNYKQLKRKYDIKNYGEIVNQLVKGIDDCASGADLYNLDNCIFVVNCHVSDEKHVKNTAEKIQDYLNNVTYKNLKLYLVTTMCVVKCPEDISSEEKVISFNNNFYRTIETRNKVTYLNQESQTKNFKLRTELNDIIKNAIENNKFEMYYQPIYSVEKKKFCSAEALIRLIDDDYGFISPALFIPAAESSGAIHQIGDFVIEDVCRFISTHNLERMGLEYIEINLSVAQCIEQNFAEKLINVLEKNGIDKSKINLEITETAADFDKETTNRNISILSSYGLSFSLDDYGTGYSNIKRVTTMPLSIIKLDKTFVDEYKSDDMKIVIKKTVDMFKKMNKLILVEGIEDKEALDHFTNIGCNYIQGYFYSRPLPEVEFVQFIRSKNKGKN